MSFDVYGYPLRQGYCEVHPEVHQSYPCSLCYAESKKVDDDKQMEKEHYRQMEIDHQRDMEIEEQKHSFARSQAIGFAEWIVANDYRAKVMCSERLPSEEGYYLTEKGTMLFSERNGCFVDDISCWAGVTYWYEPATRVVLTVEEWEEISKKLFMYDNGLGDRDMINDNKPTDI